MTLHIIKTHFDTYSSLIWASVWNSLAVAVCGLVRSCFRFILTSLCWPTFHLFLWSQQEGTGCDRLIKCQWAVKEPVPSGSPSGYGKIMEKSILHLNGMNSSCILDLLIYLFSLFFLIVQTTWGGIFKTRKVHGLCAVIGGSLHVGEIFC